MDLGQIVKDVVMTKVCSISPFKGSNDHKAITLEVRIDGVPLQGVFDKAISGTVIQWQNGQGRKKYDSWENKQVVKVDFKAPAVTVVDPRQAVKAEARALPKDERAEYLEGLIRAIEELE